MTVSVPKLRCATCALFVWFAAATAAAQAAPVCDYAFILRQPTFQLVAPEESSVNASLATPLGIRAQTGDFKLIRAVRLLPDAGATLDLSPKFKPVSNTIATMALPELTPSTTYQVELTVRVLGAPAGCPKTLTERVARFTTEPATSLDAIALKRARSIAPVAGKLSGPEIFENALKELRAMQPPPFVNFVVTTRSTIRGKAFVEAFRSSVRTSDDLVNTHSIPIASTNKPESPYGWNINIPLLSQLFRQRKGGNYDEPFGVPQISPLYSFGLRPPAPAQFSRTRPVATPSADIKTLGHIRTVGRDYDASLVGTEPFFNRYVYHLKLTPLGDPKVYRLRELWVDTQAFIIWKLHVDGIFDHGAATTVPWDVYFTIVEGHWFMALETTSASLHTGGFLAGTPETMYDGVSYRFSDFVFPDNEFDFDFFNELKTDAVQY